MLCNDVTTIGDSEVEIPLGCDRHAEVVDHTVHVHDHPAVLNEGKLEPACNEVDIDCELFTSFDYGLESEKNDSLVDKKLWVSGYT